MTNIYERIGKKFVAFIVGFCLSYMFGATVFVTGELLTGGGLTSYEIFLGCAFSGIVGGVVGIIITKGE